MRVWVLMVCFVAGSVVRAFSQDFSEKTNTMQVANILGVEAQVSRLKNDMRQGADSDMERMMSRQQLYMAVLAASLDVDSVLGEIDNESAQLSEMRDSLQGRRDRALNITTIGNIVAGAGGSIIGTAMQLNDDTAILGDKIGVASGAASTALQVYSLHQQHGGKAAVGRIPNMLAPFFGRETVLQSNYPSSVWKYLNSAPAGTSQSRVQTLISQWVHTGRIGAPSAQSSQPKITQLTGSMNSVSVGIDTITDRLAMLADVRGRVSLMKRDLADLLRSVSDSSLASREQIQ